VIIIFLGMIAAYLIGSIPTAYIVAKITRGIDIRMVGSGNVGATNVYRTMGFVAGAVVMIIDIAKGALATYYMPLVCANPDVRPGYEFTASLLIAISVIAGHVWPIFLGFRGGKGVATTAGVLLILAPNVLLGAFIVWFLLFVAVRIVSLASILAGISLPIFGFIFKVRIELVIFLAVICLLDVYKHRANVKRLLRGREKKLF